MEKLKTACDCRLALAFDVVNTTAYISEDVLALDWCDLKPLFSAWQGLLDFAKVCQVADPYDRVQRLILTDMAGLGTKEPTTNGGCIAAQIMKLGYQKAKTRDRRQTLWGIRPASD